MPKPDSNSERGVLPLMILPLGLPTLAPLIGTAAPPLADTGGFGGPCRATQHSWQVPQHLLTYLAPKEGKI